MALAYAMLPSYATPKAWEVMTVKRFKAVMLVVALFAFVASPAFAGLADDPQVPASQDDIQSPASQDDIQSP